MVTDAISEPCVDVMDRACVPIRPVEAIVSEDDIPAPWTVSLQVNDEFCEEIGSPGGTAKLGSPRRSRAAPTVLIRRRSGRALS